MVGEKSSQTPVEVAEQLFAPKEIKQEEKATTTSGAGEVKAPVETTPKTYSEEEYTKALETERKRYAGLDEKLTKVSKRYEETTTKLDEMRREAESAQLQNFLGNLDNSGLDPRAATSLQTMLRQAQEDRVQLRQLTETLREKEELLNEAGKNKAAFDIVREYELGEDTLGDLLKSNDVAEMRVKALELRLEKIKQEQQPVVKTAQPAGGIQEPVDYSKLNPSIALGMLVEKEERKRRS